MIISQKIINFWNWFLDEKKLLATIWHIITVFVINCKTLFPTVYLFWFKCVILQQRVHLEQLWHLPKKIWKRISIFHEISWKSRVFAVDFPNRPLLFMKFRTKIWATMQNVRIRIYFDRHRLLLCWVVCQNRGDKYNFREINSGKKGSCN